MCLCEFPERPHYFPAVDLLTEKPKSSGEAVTVSKQCAATAALPFAFYCTVISLPPHLSLYQVKGQCGEMKLHCSTNCRLRGEGRRRARLHSLGFYGTVVSALGGQRYDCLHNVHNVIMLISRVKLTAHC